MNGSQNETFLSLFLLRLGVGEGAAGDGDIVADVRQLDRRAAVLPVDRRPAIELKAAGSGPAAQEDERQRAVLRRIAGAHRYDVGIGARNDLRPALEVG